MKIKVESCRNKKVKTLTADIDISKNDFFVLLKNCGNDLELFNIGYKITKNKVNSQIQVDFHYSNESEIKVTQERVVFKPIIKRLLPYFIVKFLCLTL